MEWLDREKQKIILSDWIRKNRNPFLLTVMDSQEFEDITTWLEHLPDVTRSIAYLNTDSEVTRIGLLESIVTEFGNDEFPKFRALYEQLSNTDIRLIVNQTIGSNIQSESHVKLESNTQTINLNSPDPESVKRFFLDSKINEFLNLFLQDFNEMTNNKNTLIICRFRGKGFDALDEKFKFWFQDHFLRKAKSNEIKILVLCEQSADDIVTAFEYNNKYCLKELELNDILSVSNQYLNDEQGLFCKGIVNEEDKIAYKLFKFKLQKNISA